MARKGSKKGARKTSSKSFNKRWGATKKNGNIGVPISDIKPVL